MSKPSLLAAATVPGRWLLTFAGYPLGGLAASLLVGPIDRPLRALAAGLLAGAVLGAVQVWGLGSRRPSPAGWVAASAAGLALGLAAGASLVGFRTGMGDLAVEGALAGAGVGALQAVLLRSRLGAPALAWPALLAVAWAAGWAVTTAAGVQVDQRFALFGSSGALVATALTAVLPIAMQRASRRPA